MITVARMATSWQWMLKVLTSSATVSAGADDQWEAVVTTIMIYPTQSGTQSGSAVWLGPHLSKNRLDCHIRANQKVNDST
jgi:hypothetical protein